MSDSFAPTARTTLRRLPARGRYDKALINAVLDEGRICHIGFVVDGQPYVLPAAYVRANDRVYVHGSTASRMMRALAGGADACLTVTLVDGFVLGRSALHHSVNFRSVVVLGRARLVTDPTEKLDALRLLTDHFVRDRWAEVRPPTGSELAATAVVALPIEEVSAKVRSGPPVDDADDYALPVWAGVVPVHACAGRPIDDGRVLAGVAPIDIRRVAELRGDDGKNRGESPAPRNEPR